MENVFPDINSNAAGIFMTNSFDMTESPYCSNSEGCAMYLAIGRLNHSCEPNVLQTHLPDTMEEALYASRRILKGDEINDCYIDLRQSVQERRSILKELFRFDCMCMSCNSSEDVIVREDRERKKAFQLDEIELIAAAEIDPHCALSIANELLCLLESEDCKKWSIRYIPHTHFSLYQLHEVIGNRLFAKLHLEKSNELHVLLSGERSAASRRTATLLSAIPVSSRRKKKGSVDT